ncbi:condensation domain-containing protein [Chitinophaga sp. GbtcB8]|uniref:condensation domain-containing protein n=1 Tax=Chitinophaga sp. GbtcB8 TaxID=2824753 RepID=UPI001C2F8E90|nr:condensation domain-containing protein [Chitinophaga sp. GbtcB8]
MSVIEIINDLRERGIPLQVQDNSIVLGNAKGKIPEYLLQKIREHKQELISFWHQFTTQANSEKIVPVGEEPSYELSFMQRNIWIDQQLNPAISYYNVGTAWTIYGEPDAERIREAVNKVVLAHEILRTGFKMIDWEPRQVVYPEMAFDLQYADVSGSQDTVKELDTIIAAARDTVFDLQRPPLFKIFLLKEAHQKYQLVFIIHHIISDGWSLRIFFEEVLKQYKGIAKPADPQKSRSLQYRDYAVWQNSRLKERNIADSRDFWLQKFSNTAGFIFSAFPFSSRQITYEGASSSFRVPDNDLQKIDVLCAALNTTRYIVLLSVIQLLLHSFTEQQIITVETGVMDRETGDLDAQIGPYLFNVPVQVHVDPSCSFRLFVQQVKAGFIAVLEHKIYPIHLIKKDVKQCNEGNDRLTNVSFTFHNEGLLNENELAVDGLRIVKSEYTPVKVLKGMSFHAYESGKHLDINIDYGLELFDKQFVETVFQEFTRLVNAVDLNPDAKIEYLVRPCNNGHTVDLNFDFV